MKIRSFCIIFILLSLLISVPVMGAEEDEVIADIDTMIKGTFYQGADVSETPLGDFTADALRFVSGADVAFVNAVDLEMVIDAGQTTMADVRKVFSEDKRLAVADVTAEQIWDYLEHGASYLVVGKDEKTDVSASSFEGFLQVSGIKYEFDAVAFAGERLKYLIIGDTQVNRHDNMTHVTLCATEDMFNGAFGYEPCEYESLDLTLSDALADYLQHGEYEATTIVSGRTSVKGVHDHPLVSRGMWIVIAGIMCVSGFLLSRFKKKIAPERSFYYYIDPNR